MKKSITLLAFALLFSFFAQAQGVGIGTTPDANAQLHVSSTLKGMIIPTMDNAAVGVLAGKTPPTGMLVYNSEIECLQVFNGTVFECTAGVSGGGTGNDGQVKANFSGSVTLTENALLGLGDWEALNLATGDITLSASPTTSWPENQAAANQTVGGIFTDDQTFTSETNDAWVENGVSGQVNVWRIIVDYPAVATTTTLECRLRNPESSFTTSMIQTVPGNSPTGQATFLLYSISDNVSLPSPNGTGYGYVIEFRSDENVTITATSVARISLFKD